MTEPGTGAEFPYDDSLSGFRLSALRSQLGHLPRPRVDAHSWPHVLSPSHRVGSPRWWAITPLVPAPVSYNGSLRRRKERTLRSYGARSLQSNAMNNKHCQQWLRDNTAMR